MSTGYRIPKLSPENTDIQEALCRLNRLYCVFRNTHIQTTKIKEKEATNLKKSKGRYMGGFRGKKEMMQLFIISKGGWGKLFLEKGINPGSKSFLWLTGRVQSITEGRHWGRSIEQLVTMNLYSRRRS